MNEAMTGIRYSPRPVQDYIRTVDGQRVGPGAHPDLAQNLAAWNLYWLSYPHLERHTDLDEGGEPLYVNLDPVVPLALETAAQFAGNVRVADLVTNLLPGRFVEEITKRPHRDLALAKFFKPDIWLAVMGERAALFTPGSQAMVVPYSLTKQSDGTKPEFSTNILPLARIFKMRLH